MNPDITYLYNITQIAQVELNKLNKLINKSTNNIRKKNKTIKKRKKIKNKTRKKMRT